MSATISDRGNRAWCAVFGLESAAIILGNILVIAAFAITKSLHKKTYYLFISLAVADLLVGAFAVPIYIHFIGGVVTNFWEIDSHVSHTSTAIDIFTAYASIFFLVVIALERVFAVFSPLNHANLSSFVYFVVIGFVWLLALIFAILSFLREEHIGIVKNTAYLIFILVMLSVSMLIVLCSYIAIFIRVYLMRSYAVNPANDFQKKMAVTLFVLSTIFIITWMPFKVVNYIFHFNSKATLACGEDNYSCIINSVYVTKLFHYGNSLVNPFVYAMGVPDFRKGARRILCCCCESRVPENPPLGEIKGIDNMVSMQSIDTVVPSMYL